MKKLLIIYPHWIPSNLVGVQRARLISNFLVRYGWQPIILAVHPDYYEEPIVSELQKTVSDDVKVYWCSAKAVKSSKRLVGDIALRAYHQLIEKGIVIAKKENVDFIWSPLPSFYTALIVRKVHDKTGVPYGLDYMDPWVHDFPGARFPNKAWLAKRVAMLLEPIAVKKVSLLTGVSELSYLPVIERNSHLKGIVCGYMPLGFAPDDYNHLPDNKQLLWENDGDVMPIIYAGAFLPQSHFYLDLLFSVVVDMRSEGVLNPRIRFYFVGTGKGNLSTITDYAAKYGINDIVTEKTERISYLEVLNNLSNAFGVLAIGNREPHYTASKIFQTVLSRKRVFPIFHRNSTVNDILKEANADKFLVRYDSSIPDEQFKANIREAFTRFLDDNQEWNPRLEGLSKYSAEASAAKLVELIEKAICQTKS